MIEKAMEYVENEEIANTLIELYNEWNLEIENISFIRFLEFYEYVVTFGKKAYVNLLVCFRTGVKVDIVDLFDFDDNNKNDILKIERYLEDLINETK